jgi:hypothetical protein
MGHRVIGHRPPAHHARHVSGPARPVRLERSFHVATLDHDRDLILGETVTFVADVAERGSHVDT